MKLRSKMGSIRLHKTQKRLRSGGRVCPGWLCGKPKEDCAIRLTAGTCGSPKKEAPTQGRYPGAGAVVIRPACTQARPGTDAAIFQALGLEAGLAAARQFRGDTIPSRRKMWTPPPENQCCRCSGCSCCGTRNAASASAPTTTAFPPVAVT